MHKSCSYKKLDFFFNPFTCILFFQSCSTHSLNMPHNIFDVFKVQQQEEWGSKQRAHAAQQPTADSVGNARCAPQRRDGAHSLIWLKNVQKVCPFAYAPIEWHPTLLLTCRLFPRVPYALLEVCRALFFHATTRVYP